MVPLYYYLNTKVSEGGLHKMGKMHKYTLSYGVVSTVYLELFSLPSFKSFIFFNIYFVDGVNSMRENDPYIF